MRRLVKVLVLTLAVNFLAVAGFVAWLHQTQRLNRERLLAIRAILFPDRADASPAAQPPAPAPTQPLLQLDELLARSTGRSATEQVQFIQQTFDTQMAQLERRERELNDLQRQVELAKQQLTRDRAELDRHRADLAARQDEQLRLASDKGFQDSLAVYNTMPAKQVKQVFMALDDATVVDYLRAMQPRAAARIIKEFKTAEELARIQTIMEKMRQADERETQAQAKE